MTDSLETTEDCAMPYTPPAAQPVDADKVTFDAGPWPFVEGSHGDMDMTLDEFNRARDCWEALRKVDKPAQMHVITWKGPQLRSKPLGPADWFKRQFLCDDTPQPQPVLGSAANAWQQGYDQGVSDERISEANIGVAGFGAKINPARENPYTRPQPQPVKSSDTHYSELPNNELPGMWDQSDFLGGATDCGSFGKLGSPPSPLYAPIDVVLYCPNCGKQHIDRAYSPEDGADWNDPEIAWTNPPHRSHLCHDCGTIWRPCDFATNGVASIQTEGKSDTWPVNGEDGFARSARNPLQAAQPVQPSGEWIDDAGRITWALWRIKDLESKLATATPIHRPLTTRELADVTAPWSNVWTDQSFGIANAAIAKFCEVNNIKKD